MGCFMDETLHATFYQTKRDTVVRRIVVGRLKTLS